MRISRGSRNAVAKELRTTKYRIRRLKNKKKYTRKVKHVLDINKESKDD